ncbi:MAG TPA: hypothetical protein VHR46_01920 [Gaiella sp.]|nr:hypothetical protein [Gaiella sp.]
MRRRREAALSDDGVDRVALVATILLAFATVATAWSGYQASRWSGEATKATMKGTAARLESTRASNLANAQAQVDVAVFTQWVDAYAKGEARLRDFYFERFRKEFKPAVVAWLATRPIKNPNAPLTPFAMPQYRSAAGDEAARLEAQADGWAAIGRRNIQRSTNYVLGVVLFAAALFFAGMSTKLPARGLRIAMLTMGIVVFVATLAWIVSSPVSVSV